MSLFPASSQYGNVFGANNSSGRNELVAFHAGKMTVRPTANGKFMITPDLKKGKVCLSRGDDQLLHFQWVDRQSGASPDDFIIFPDDASFIRAHTGREGDRVYLLQYKNSSRRFFFWMQHKDSSRDEELAKKVNDFMNNVQPAGDSDVLGGGRSGAGNVQLDHNAIMQMLGAMGAGGEQGRGGGAAGSNSNVQVSDLQSILQNMGLPASQAAAAAAASPAPSAASSSQASAGASSAAATTASTHDHDVSGMEVDEMTEDELLRLAIEESMRDVQQQPDAAQVPATPPPTSVTPAPAPTPVPAPAPAPGAITAADLARAMASIQAFTQPKGVSLGKLLSAENVAPLVDDEAAVNAVVQHLPEGAQNAHELQATLRSPQLRQSIGSLVNALKSGNYNAVLANFGLDPAAGATKLAFGDSIGAFLDAIQQWADQQDTTMSEH